jgi:multisubunit Na+/H+ antiporter MnhF subunit
MLDNPVAVLYNVRQTIGKGAHMFGGYIAGFASLVLVMLPGIVILLVSLRLRDGTEKGKRIIAFISLAANLMAILGFLSFLYARPTFLNLNVLHALPLLTRFIFNPWILHSFMMVTFLIIGLLHWVYRKPLRREHSFSVITIVILLITLCLWILGSTFHYGLTGRILVGGRLSTKMLIPLHSLITFLLFFVVLTVLYSRYLRKRRFMWFLSIFLLLCGLVSYHFFAWYLPTFSLSP